VRVQLYRNLKPQYKGKRVWSLKAADGPKKGLVVYVVDGAILKDAKFVVNEKARQYTIKTQRKFVHAWVEGTLVKTFPVGSLAQDTDGNDLAPGKGVKSRIGYNPYTMPKMIREDCVKPVERSPLVVAAPEGVFAKLGTCSNPLQGLAEAAYYDVDGWNG